MKMSKIEMVHPGRGARNQMGNPDLNAKHNIANI